MEEHQNGKTHNELFSEVGFIRGKIEGMDNKLDLFLASINKHTEEDDRRFDGINGRVIKIENELSRAKGIAAIIAFIVGIGSSFVKDLIFPKTS